MKRATKLVFHEHRVVCPYCRTAIIFNSPMEVILLARRECPNCGREFLIENGTAKRLRGNNKSRKSR